LDNIALYFKSRINKNALLQTVFFFLGREGKTICMYMDIKKAGRKISLKRNPTLL